MQKQCFSKSLRLVNLVLLLILAAGFLNSTFSASGQTDRLKGAPFYKTYNKKAVVRQEAAGYLPVGIDQITRLEFFYAGHEPALQPLVEAMNAYLDSLKWCTPLSGDSLPEKGAPYVYVGSAEGEGAPPEAAMQRNEHDKYPPMVIHILKPSGAWRSALGTLALTQPVEHFLRIQIGFSEYPKADKGMFGKKVVLGTGYEEGIKFLSAEDKPVEVLQITGVLLDRDGNIVRAGAEGIVAKDTPFWAQVLDIQQGMNNDALQKLLLEERRSDLPGQPLKWQAALRNLMAQLLGQPGLMVN